MVSVVAAMLMATLTRAEAIERFRAGPVRQVDGLVEVWADCPAAMRREFQVPVASYVGEVCKRLYQANSTPMRSFREAALVVHVGDSTNVVTNVLTRVDRRDDGSVVTRIYLPAPGHADLAALCEESAKAWYRAVQNRELDTAAARAEYRKAFPELRIADEYASLEAWRRGEIGPKDDEKLLKLQRTIIQPGKANPDDVRLFASRLRLYPDRYDLRFADGADSCDFREAIAKVGDDPLIQICALNKVRDLQVFGGGHGDGLSEAAALYVKFLLLLAEDRASAAELTAALDAAETKLKGVKE